MFTLFSPTVKFSHLVFHKNPIVQTVGIKDDFEQTQVDDRINLARAFLDERGITDMKPLIKAKG
jgi:hypothetical protein